MKETGQFSIYKVDLEKVEEMETIDKSDANYLEVVRRTLLELILKKIKRKTDYFYKLEKGRYEGYFFKTKNKPVWNHLIAPILVSNIDLFSDEFQNTNASYILTFLSNQNIYIMTAGFGSQYIKDYTEVSFGLNLLPKLLDEDKSVLKEVSHVGMTGNRLASSYMNKMRTNFAVERDMNNIYKQLIAEIDTVELYNLGLLPTPNGRKNTSLMSTDSLVIRRSITLNELQEILFQLDHIQQKPSRFALSYFEAVKNDKITKEELQRNFINCLVNKSISAFTIVGKDYMKYMEEGRKYILTDKQKKIFIEQEEPLTIKDIYEELEKRQMAITRVLIQEIFFKWNLSVIDKNGIYVISSLPLIKCLQGEISNDRGDPCYLFEEKWYKFSKSVMEVLTQEFIEYYIAKKVRVEQLKEDYGLYCVQKTETEYNDFLKENNKIIVSHLIRIGNIEIADAIFWDDHNLYLLHNKDAFNNVGVRDLSGQIRTSAHTLQTLLQSANVKATFQQYYEDIMRKYPEQSEKITKDKFVDLFFNKKICYVAGYVNSYRKESKSPYGKYITVLLNKEMIGNGYEFLSMNLT